MYLTCIAYICGNFRKKKGEKLYIFNKYDCKNVTNLAREFYEDKSQGEKLGFLKHLVQYNKY